MPYGLTVVTPPAKEPVPLSDLKQHARIEQSFTDDDPLVTSLGVAAREYCETLIDRAFMTQTVALTIDSFPLADKQRPMSVYQTQTAFGVIRLPRPPLQLVTQIQYLDTTGTLQILDPSIYLVSATTEPGRITPAYGKIWPVTRWQNEAVKVTYVAGFTDVTLVPERAKLAIKMLASFWYEYRGESVPPELEKTLWNLLSSVWPGTLYGAS